MLRRTMMMIHTRTDGHMIVMMVMIIIREFFCEKMTCIFFQAGIIIFAPHHHRHQKKRLYSFQKFFIIISFMNPFLSLVPIIYIFSHCLTSFLIFLQFNQHTALRSSIKSGLSTHKEKNLLFYYLFFVSCLCEVIASFEKADDFSFLFDEFPIKIPTMRTKNEIFKTPFIIIVIAVFIYFFVPRRHYYYYIFCHNGEYK